MKSNIIGFDINKQEQQSNVSKVVPEYKAGAFLVIMQKKEAHIFFSAYPFGWMNKQCAVATLSHEYMEAFNPQTDNINDKVKLDLKHVNTIHLPASSPFDRSDVMPMIEGFIAGLSTVFNPIDPSNTSIASIPYVIYDTLGKTAHISLFHKEEYLNHRKIGQTLKLNNSFEVAHSSNTRQIKPITEEYIDSLGLTHANMIEISLTQGLNDSNLGTEPMIAQEQWVGFKGYGDNQTVVYTCYHCNTTSTEKCSCQFDGLTTANLPKLYVLENDDEYADEDE